MNAENRVFSVMLYGSRKRHALACYTFDMDKPILIIFVDNKVLLSSTVRNYYFPPTIFVQHRTVR